LSPVCHLPAKHNCHIILKPRCNKHNPYITPLLFSEESFPKFTQHDSCTDANGNNNNTTSSSSRLLPTDWCRSVVAIRTQYNSDRQVIIFALFDGDIVGIDFNTVRLFELVCVDCWFLLMWFC